MPVVRSDQEYAGTAPEVGMVTQMVALGPEFDLLPDDTEESLLGAPIHKYGIVAIFTSLRRHARRLGLPWFIGNQTTLVIPRASGRPYQPAPDLLERRLRTAARGRTPDGAGTAMRGAAARCRGQSGWR